MTVDDAAGVLNVTEAQVRALCGAGKLGKSKRKYFKARAGLSPRKWWIVDGAAVQKRARANEARRARAVARLVGKKKARRR